MRFLHTADWQIGMKAAALGEAGTRVREERLHAARRVVQAARDQGAAFILVAGDTFEDNAVDRVLVQQVTDILNAFPGPVFVIPGNHDPLGPGAVWEHPAWGSAVRVQVLRDAAPVPVPGGLLYPCPVREKRSDRDPTAWISAAGEDAIHIGLAHGTVEGVRQDEPDYPIARNAAQRCTLDYLALGHWHSYAAYPDAAGHIRMAYSGTHETTKFGERDSGNALLVEIDGPGAPPEVTPVRTAGLVWRQISEDLRESGDLLRVRELVEVIDNTEDTLLELTLTGLITAEETDALTHIRQVLESRFLFGRLDMEALCPSPEDDGWISALPPGVVREAALRLREQASSNTNSAATRALLDLYALVEEVKS